MRGMISTSIGELISLEVTLGSGVGLSLVYCNAEGFIFGGCVAGCLSSFDTLNIYSTFGTAVAGFSRLVSKRVAGEGFLSLGSKGAISVAGF